MHHYIPKFEISEGNWQIEGQQKRNKRAKQTSDDADEKEKLTLKMDNIDKDIANLESKIPSDWKAVSEEYQKLLKVLPKLNENIVELWMIATAVLTKLLKSYLQVMASLHFSRY